MDDGPDDEDAPSGIPTCPNCERPVMSVTIVGPTEAVVGPCGCGVVPESVIDGERD